MVAASDKALGERVAHIEGKLDRLIPTIERMEAKLDEALELARAKASKESVQEAHDRIDKVEVALVGKADKAEVKEVRDKILLWTGGLIVIGWLATKFGDRLFTVLFAK